uniref:Uncharacterized protein ORF147 n=1 Tax=Phaeoceros laevis TaxID=37308 RepID=D3J0K6_9EMBR|nr:hypothetical protein PhlaMp39 [Phaeoceros laevis]ACT75320.1 hypothetical protein PhlaMp39 [Phaeoceros laevis]
MTPLLMALTLKAPGSRPAPNGAGTLSLWSTRKKLISKNKAKGPLEQKASLGGSSFFGFQCLIKLPNQRGPFFEAWIALGYFVCSGQSCKSKPPYRQIHLRTYVAIKLHAKNNASCISWINHDKCLARLHPFYMISRNKFSVNHESDM